MYDKGRILAVDDTPTSLKLVTELLKAEGYEVRSALNGELALNAAVSNPPELVLLDIRMPVMDGLEVCRRLKADPNTREVPVIFVSAASEVSEKLLGFEVGAVDYVTKPYQRDELLARVRTHLELYRLRHRLEGLVAARTADLLASERRVKDSLLETITAFAVLVEMRDPYTAGHQRRVAHLASAIATEMRMTDHGVDGVRLAGVVHDIGKIQIPTEILSKPGRLTPVEFELIKQHAVGWYEILKAINFPWPIAQIVRQHHERLDGSGYPQALTSDQILLEAKILAVADVVESIISHRPYRPGLGLAAALDEINTHKGRLFDPPVVEACFRLFKELGYVLPD